MGETILLVVLIVIVVALFCVSYFRKKKFNNELGTMREELKVGDKVMTDTGVVGEVVDSFTEEEYKYFVLKTGNKDHVGYFTVHANAIYYVFGKEDKKQEKTVIKVAEPKKVEVDEAKEEPKVETVEPKEETKTEPAAKRKTTKK